MDVIEEHFSSQPLSQLDKYCIYRLFYSPFKSNCTKRSWSPVFKFLTCNFYISVINKIFFTWYLPFFKSCSRCEELKRWTRFKDVVYRRITPHLVYYLHLLLFTWSFFHQIGIIIICRLSWKIRIIVRYCRHSQNIPCLCLHQYTWYWFWCVFHVCISKCPFHIVLQNFIYGKHYVLTVYLFLVFLVFYGNILTVCIFYIDLLAGYTLELQVHRRFYTCKTYIVTWSMSKYIGCEVTIRIFPSWFFIKPCIWNIFFTQFFHMIKTYILKKDCTIFLKIKLFFELFPVYIRNSRCNLVYDFILPLIILRYSGKLYPIIINRYTYSQFLPTWVIYGASCRHDYLFFKLLSLCHVAIFFMFDNHQITQTIYYIYHQNYKNPYTDFQSIYHQFIVIYFSFLFHSFFIFHLKSYKTVSFFNKSI